MKLKAKWVRSEPGLSGGGDGSVSAAGSPGSNAGAGAGAGPSGGLGGGGSSEGGAAGSPSAEGGAAGASESLAQTVSTLGCFAESGDGWDLLLNGQTPPIVDPGESACGKEVSDNVDGFAPEVTPTSFVLKRRFVLDASIADAAAFTVSFVADDAVDFVLNGQSVASCTPPAGNIGECSSSCHAVLIPSTALLGAGQVNTLEITVTNLLSVDAGNGNFGWTGIRYSICAASSTLNDGLVSRWRGDGDARDSVGTNDGLLQGAVTFVPGKIGQAFAFNGTDAVSIPTSTTLNVTQGYTLAYWIKASAWPASEVLVVNKWTSAAEDTRCGRAQWQDFILPRRCHESDAIGFHYCIDRGHLASRSNIVRRR